MNPSDFPVGSIVRYYGEVRIRPHFIAAHNPAMGSYRADLSDRFALTEKWPFFDHPEIEDVIELLGIDHEILTIIRHEK